MAKERGLIQMIMKAFLDSLIPRYSSKKLVGTDYFGTKYYEVANLTSKLRKPNRFFEPVNKEDFQQEIPAEWEAWLRNRRKNPPSEKEVLENYEMIVTKRKNAAELEEKYASMKQVIVLNPDQKPPDQHASMNFPFYEEYKDHGKSYKLKIPKKYK